MSIATEITRLDTAKTNLKDSINTKGGNLTTETLDDYYLAVDGLSTGGGGNPSIEPVKTADFLVRYFDFDGVILKQEWINSGNDSTPPTTPTHDYLTFDYWNNPYVNITGPTDIGAIYNTVDNKTYAWVNVLPGNLTFAIGYGKTDGSALTIDWGDLTTNILYTNNTTISTSHTYAAEGRYLITMWISTGTGNFILGIAAGSYPVFGYSATADSYWILESIYIGTNCQFGPFRPFENARGLKTISLSNSITSLSTFFVLGCIILKHLNIPSSITAMPQQMARFTGFRTVVFPSTVVSINAYLNDGYDSGMSDVVFPASVTSFGTYIFSKNYHMLKMICKSTTPPTISSLTFGDIGLLLKIYVPDASLTAYKTATNWVTHASKIYGFSTFEGYEVR